MAAYEDQTINQRCWNTEAVFLALVEGLSGTIRQEGVTERTLISMRD